MNKLQEVLRYDIRDLYGSRYAEYLAAEAKEELQSGNFREKDIIESQFDGKLPDGFFDGVQRFVSRDKSGEAHLYVTGIDFDYLKANMSADEYESLFDFYGLRLNYEDEGMDDYQNASCNMACIEDTYLFEMSDEEIKLALSNMIHTYESTTDIAHDIESLRGIWQKVVRPIGIYDDIEAEIAAGTIVNAGKISVLDINSPIDDDEKHILETIASCSDNIKTVFAESLGISEDIERKASIDIKLKSNNSGFTIVARDFLPDADNLASTHFHIHDAFKSAVESETATLDEGIRKYLEKARLISVTPTNQSFYVDGNSADISTAIDLSDLPSHKNNETELKTALVSESEKDIDKQNEGNSGLG